MTAHYQHNWQIYVESWRAATRDEKIRLFQQCLATDCCYTDPLTQTIGWEALLEYMLDFHQQIPGGHFVTTWFLAHHGCSIAQWQMRDGSDQVLGTGISYGSYDNDGKLVSMTGLFEQQ